QAVRIVRERNCAIIFIDIKLPVMNGLETLLRLKKINPGLNAIMMTGYREEMRQIIDEALEASAVTCLYKPFDPWKALDLIHRLNGRSFGVGKQNEREEQHISR
ncbi:response regulator, partial [Chloroflexota bacterium]